MIRRGLVFCACLVLLSAIAFAQAKKDQDFSISGKLDGLNAYHDLAVSSKTGDVFVAWERRVKKGGSTVIDGLYGVLMKQKKNGKYKAKKIQTLWKTQKIDIGTGYKQDDNYQFPKVAYNPENNTFLTVFASGRTNSAYAQLIKAKTGKKLGDPVLVMPGSEPGNPTAKDCTDITIYYVGSSAAPTSAGPFLAFFRYDYRDDPGNWRTVPCGIHTAWLDSSGVMVTEAAPLFKNLIGDQTQSGGYLVVQYYVDSLIKTSDGKFLLGITKPKLMGNNEYYYTSYAAKLDANANLVKTQKVGKMDSWGPTSIAKLSDKMYVFVWRDNWKKIKCATSTFNNSYYDTNLKKQKNSMKVYNPETVFSALALNLDQDTRAYEIFAMHTDSAVHGRFVNTDGSLGNTTKIFSFSGEFADLMAKCIPGTNRIFIAYGSSVEETFLDKQEIRGHVYTAK